MSTTTIPNMTASPSTDRGRARSVRGHHRAARHTGYICRRLGRGEPVGCRSAPMPQSAIFSSPPAQYFQQHLADQVRRCDRHPPRPRSGCHGVPGGQCPLSGIRLGRWPRELHLRNSRTRPHSGDRQSQWGQAVRLARGSKLRSTMTRGLWWKHSMCGGLPITTRAIAESTALR